MDSRFCSFTPCLKNAKNTKGQSAICEGLEKLQKKYKNTNCIFGRNGNIQKNTKIQRVFFGILFGLFRIFFGIFTKKIRKHTKNTKKIRMQLPKNTKYKKNTNQQFQKYKIQKKIRINNFKNTKYKKKYEPKISKIQNTKKKTNSKISQRANPVFTFGNQEPKYQKKIQNQPVVFSKPSVLILYFWVVFFSYFFVF